MSNEKIDPRFAEFARTGDQQLRNALVVDNQGLAIAFARRYRGRGVSNDDLEQIALEALVSAVDRFDVARGLRFSTFAARTIDGSLKQYFRDRTWDLKVPRSTRQLIVAIRSMTESLTQRNGRKPTLAEIAEGLDVDLAEVTLALEAAESYRTADLDAVDPGAGAGSDPALARVEAGLVTRQLLSTLDDVERTVVELRFFEGLSQDDIAGRIGVSQMQVSRLLRRALERLRGQLEPG